MRITLIDTIATLHPSISCHSVGDPDTYSSIDWGELPLEEIPTETTLRQEQLALYKQAKIAELSESCRLAIVGGFSSSALGTPHVYDSDIEDQINLAGAFIVTLPSAANPDGSTVPYACRNATTLIKSYITHTHVQMQQVLQEGAAFKLALLQHFNGLRDQVNASTSVSEVLGFEWCLPP